ncbi:ATP-binding protein [Paenibacillus sonchi]|uniref:ATP-binding protein n=1 Tax=Paenibacillus sonchi TaxID=373687 RepID=UPI0002F35031|nr:ATP-binding protein [Paenibacillus sonchi]
MSEHPFYMDLLVLFSIVIACLSSFIAVDLAERMVRYKRSVFFVLFSSGALGIGMWSMHYISMIAMKHESTASYYIPMLLLSLFVPIAASYVLLMLFNNTRTRSSKAALGFGGLLFSCGLLIMHCSGMMSVRYTAAFEQSTGSILGSLVLSLAVPAITASYHPNWTAKRYNMFSAKKLLLILVLTAVLSGTNYIAMAGASYVDTGPYIYVGRTPLLNDSMLGMILACTFLLVVAVVLGLMYKDRKQVLFTAQFNEQRYTALFEFSPDMVVCIDPVRKKVISANPSLRQTTGYGQEELSDYKSILFSTGDEQALKAAVKRAARGQSGKLEIIVKTKSGARLICSTTVFPLVNDKENYVYIIAEDITALAEQQQELLIAKNAAESAARMKSEFLATMSHEIRTPLNGIIGINQLLAEEITAPDHQELLKLQNTSSLALLSVMNDVLDISRLEAENMLLVKAPFKLPALLRECINLFAVAAGHKGLALNLEIAPSIPEQLIGDSARIRQILVNLIGNAVKFTHEGGITVTIEPYSKEGTSLGLLFRVSDTGIGIAPDKLELLFQPFSQVDASHNRKYQGTGLGLAICKKLVELMDGSIWTEKAREGGTDFFFKIPLQLMDTFPREAYSNEQGVREKREKSEVG